MYEFVVICWIVLELVSELCVIVYFWILVGVVDYCWSIVGWDVVGVGVVCFVLCLWCEEISYWLWWEDLFL